MDRKTKGVLVLLALLLSGAQVGRGAAASPPIELGYGPTALFPVQTGTPVYAVGDQMWARSGFNATVHLDIQPAQTVGAPPTAEVALAPGIPTLLHVFSSDDPLGLWILTSPDAGPGFSPVFFEVSATTVSSSLGVSSHRLSGGTLAVNLSVSGGLQFYDGEACLVGGSQGAPSVGVPASAGSATASAAAMAAIGFLMTASF